MRRDMSTSSPQRKMKYTQRNTIKSWLTKDKNNTKDLNTCTPEIEESVLQKSLDVKFNKSGKKSKKRKLLQEDAAIDNLKTNDEECTTGKKSYNTDITSKSQCKRISTIPLSSVNLLPKAVECTQHNTRSKRFRKRDNRDIPSSSNETKAANGLCKEKENKTKENNSALSKHLKHDNEVSWNVRQSKAQQNQKNSAYMTPRKHRRDEILTLRKSPRNSKATQEKILNPKPFIKDRPENKYSKKFDELNEEPSSLRTSLRNSVSPKASNEKGLQSSKSLMKDRLDNKSSKKFNEQNDITYTVSETKISNSPKWITKYKYEDKSFKENGKKYTERPDEARKKHKTKGNYKKSKCFNETSDSTILSDKEKEQQDMNVTPTKSLEKGVCSSLRRSPKNTATPTSLSHLPTVRKIFEFDMFSQSEPQIKENNIKNEEGPVKTNNREPELKSPSELSERGTNVLKLKKRKNRILRVAEKRRTSEHTLDKFITKSSNPKFSRSQSTESCELPSFISNKKKGKSSATSDSFKKYGVTIPSVKEILKEQEDLIQYKNQIASFKELNDDHFKISFSIKDLNKNQIVKKNVLGCKHLSLVDIETAFYKNLDNVSAIFHGKKRNDRHDRFFSKHSGNYTFTDKDLCYNTSAIVFSFEQKEHMISLLKQELDPENKWTAYFFQVLLPELCLQIFMDAHNMTYEEAVNYLDTRPIIED